MPLYQLYTVLYKVPVSSESEAVLSQLPPSGTWQLPYPACSCHLWLFQLFLQWSVRLVFFAASCLLLFAKAPLFHGYSSLLCPPILPLSYFSHSSKSDKRPAAPGKASGDLEVPLQIV